ncbi:MAG: 2OG-Fe(II) oxygenase [Cyclobacteriaceae bacterium]
MERKISVDWDQARASLDSRGFVRIPSVLPEKQCLDICDLYQEETLFRSTINMQRYRFGMGEYKYFGYPLPALIQSLREEFFEPLVPLANEWMNRLGVDTRYPSRLPEFLSLCHSKGQKRPTPLVLRYEGGGYNTLHQDIYGEIFFPFQVVFILTQPGRDYEGGELVFVEQLPRAQSRAEVVIPQQGDAVIFTTNFRPVKGSKGYYRAKMKHGVSPVKQGLRYTMGIIFHDAS